MGYHFSSRLTATLDLCPIYFEIKYALNTLLEHMHKKFEINWTKIRVAVSREEKRYLTHNSKSDLPLVCMCNMFKIKKFKNRNMYAINETPCIHKAYLLDNLFNLSVRRGEE